MSVQWKGWPVAFVERNPSTKKATYILYDDVAQPVAIITDIQYLSSRQLRSLPHGLHRRTNPKNNSGAAGAAAGGAFFTDPALQALYDTIPFGISPAASALAAPIQARVSTIRSGHLPTTSWRTFNDGLDPPPRPALRRETITAGEIIGYRCWRIENGLLRSVYQADIWHPLTPLEGRELGDWDSRGIHAWKDAGGEHYHNYIRGYLNCNDDLNPMRRRVYHNPSRPAMATGTVSLWGDVVEHERGYRGEFAKVRSLDWLYPDANMLGNEAQTLQSLRTLYHV